MGTLALQYAPVSYEVFACLTGAGYKCMNYKMCVASVFLLLQHNPIMSDWDVSKWLNEIGLEERYAQSFIDNGYDLPNLCANLKDEDLDAIEVNQEDRNELFQHVVRLRHWSVARKPIKFDDSLTTISNGNIVHSDDSSNGESSIEYQQQPSDSLGASNELSVKSPDSLRSVSSELSDHTPLSKTDESEGDCKLSSLHAPKKPPRSFKHRVPPPPLPTSNSSQSQGLSRLQLKLKLKQELQKDHIVITEHPYIQVSQVDCLRTLSLDC